ncbi:MAG TPA: 6-phosphofructokinase, partial [Longimicrobiales bacterium]|nr:6-phosphofructokinase [Longimicrobiales bacterium]
LHSGIAGTADVILMPEIPYDIDRVIEKVNARYRSGRNFAIIVAAEGALPVGGGEVLVEGATPGAAKRYGGIAEQLGRQIAERTTHEVRTLVLGHLQRGGTPTTYDRLVALRFGAAAVRCVEERKFGTMVALDPPDIKAVPIEDAVRQIKTVPIQSDTVQTARDIGISFGD